MAGGSGEQQRPEGIAFPVRGERRSATGFGREVLATAATAADATLGAAITDAKDWRKRYGGFLRQLVETELRAPVDGGAVPRAGLDALYAGLEFHRYGTAIGLEDALGLASDTVLHTVELRGREPAGRLVLPYGGEQLSDDLLVRQLDRWVDGGIIEPSCADAVGRLTTHPEWLDLSRFTVVVLGAGAELSPLPDLCRWGATVVPVDLPRPEVWERIIATVRAGTARALIPLHRPVDPAASDAEVAAAAGADLTRDLPELAGWLGRLQGPVTVGMYAYAHGADHVRVAMAQDALAVHLLRGPAEVSLAGLLTPTDVYAVPETVVTASRARFDALGPLPRLGRLLSAGRTLAPHYPQTIATGDGSRYGVADAIVAQQGPSYALAKRLQQWRLRLARHEGVRVSANVAPATRTRSVTSNRVLASAYAGAARFGVEVFEPATTATLMAALLAHDLHRPPATPPPGTPVPHELELFSDGAAHGGMWTTPYAPGSVLPLAALLGLGRG